MNFFTADWHIFDEEIIQFCKRPHQNVDHAIKRIIGDANMRVKKDDTLFHIGDFCVKREGKHPRYILPLINAKLVQIEGNHDANNGVKAEFKYAVLNVGQKRALLSHYPTFNKNNEVINRNSWDFLRDNARNLVDFVLCGHIHDAWHWAKDDYNGLININVGLDKNRYMPINVQEVLAIWNQAKGSAEKNS